jgi:hypothetical protein
LMAGSKHDDEAARSARNCHHGLGTFRYLCVRAGQ